MNRENETPNNSKPMAYDALLAAGVDKNEAKLRTTAFFIEANSFETLELWKEYKDKVNWIEDNMGFWQQIGEIGEGMPVCVLFTFAEIYGKRICFYDVTSRYSDSQMVENFLETNYPVKWDKGSRRAMTNAMNFHHAVAACRNG